MDLENELGNRLAKLRKDAGLTRHEVAEAVDAAWLTVYRWETGYSSPQWRFQKKLADLYGITIVFLMQGNELLHDPNQLAEEQNA